MIVDCVIFWHWSVSHVLETKNWSFLHDFIVPLTLKTSWSSLFMVVYSWQFIDDLTKMWTLSTLHCVLWLSVHSAACTFPDFPACYGAAVPWHVARLRLLALFEKTCATSQNKKLSYRRETARQLPTWGGLSPPALSPSARSGYTYAYGRIWNPQQT